MGLDEAVADALAQAPWPQLQPLAGALYYAGSIYGWWVLVLLLALRRRWSLALPLAAALVLADGVAYVLKELVARPRPPGALFHGSDFAFPSGHTLRAAAAATLAWGLALPRGWRFAAVAFALLMGASRLVARAHWATDVLASLALGLAIGVGVTLGWRGDLLGLRSWAEAVLARLGWAPRAPG